LVATGTSCQKKADTVALQQAEDGDVLCVFATGAYCQSMASNYNKQVRPGGVFVRDGAARLVVRRETYDALMRCDVE
jgi:diaminopimelate decarboxylase